MPAEQAPAPRCQCEAEACTHPYLAAAAAPGTRAMFVGPVCLDCARSHLSDYMLSVLYEGTGRS